MIRFSSTRHSISRILRQVFSPAQADITVFSMKKYMKRLLDLNFTMISHFGILTEIYILF